MRGGSLLEREQGIARYFFGNRFVAASEPRRDAFAEESAFLVLPSGQRERSAQHQVALYAGDHKLVRVGGREELFDLASDPLEGSNIVAAQPKVASEMRRRLDRLLRDLGNGGGGPREDIEEALRALGYVR